jgi:hypothetical protein
MALALLVACLSTLIASQPIANQPPLAREVRGRVIDAVSRAPIADVTATLSPTMFPPAAYGPLQAITDENGTFRFQRLMAGRYRLQAQKPGFATLAARAAHGGVDRGSRGRAGRRRRCGPIVGADDYAGRHHHRRCGRVGADDRRIDSALTIPRLIRTATGRLDRPARPCSPDRMTRRARGRARTGGRARLDGAGGSAAGLSATLSRLRRGA